MTGKTLPQDPPLELQPLEKVGLADYLGRLTFVRWDRMTFDPGQIEVYGWIYREGRGGDERADFVLLHFLREGGEIDAPAYTTSSAARSIEIGEILYAPHLTPDEVAAAHNACQRVEDVLPAVENAIRR